MRLPDDGAADAGAPASARLQCSEGLERPGVGGGEVAEEPGDGRPPGGVADEFQRYARQL